MTDLLTGHPLIARAVLAIAALSALPSTGRVQPLPGLTGVVLDQTDPPAVGLDMGQQCGGVKQDEVAASEEGCLVPDVLPGLVPVDGKMN